MGNQDLIDQLFGPDKYHCLRVASERSRESLVKDYIHASFKEVLQFLNKNYNDVEFSAEWVINDGNINIHGDLGYKDLYDEHTASDVDDIPDMLGDFDDNDLLYSESLEVLGIKLQYWWVQHCSLGHTHYNKKYRLIGVPVLLNMLHVYKLGANAGDLVSQFIPDFFYQ